jgi:hypothetical protein
VAAMVVAVAPVAAGREDRHAVLARDGAAPGRPVGRPASAARRTARPGPEPPLRGRRGPLSGESRPPPVFSVAPV